MENNLTALVKRTWLIVSFLFITLLANAQQYGAITGTVNNQRGEPLVNITVTLKNVTKETSTQYLTDSVGVFRIDKLNPADTYSITAIAVGYNAKTISGYKIKAGKNTNVIITLSEDHNVLTDIVITGYQDVQKKLFTGSSSTLTVDQVERAGLPDITKMLEGQFAGVSLQNVSGTFGAAPKLRIRGATSLSGDNKPLWVIDGIIVEDVVNISNEALSTGDLNTLLGSSVAGINPSDIQDITILRDAAATALYGARAMNGVVVITTKKGAVSTKPRINYTGNFSTYIKPSYSNYDIMNSADQMAVLMEVMNKGGFQMPGLINGDGGGVLYKMYQQIALYDSTTGTFGLRNDAASRNAFLSRYTNANTDWFDIIFKNSLIQEHNVSVSSGTENYQTYVSTSYLKDNGMTLGNSVERFTGNFRNNFKIGKKLSGEILSTGSMRRQRAPGTENRVSEPVYGEYLRGFDINPYNFVLNTSRMITPYDENGDLEYFRQNYAPFNIINELNTNYTKLNVLDFKVQGRLKYTIIPGLNYTLNGAYRFVKSESQTSILENSNKVMSYRAAQDANTIGSNENLYDDPDFPNELPVVVLPEGGFYNTETDNLKYFYFRQDLQYDKVFRNEHTISLYGSMEARSTDRQHEYFDGIGYQFENGGLVNSNHLYFKRAQEEGRPYFGMQPGKDRFLAYAASGTYAYKDKYVIKATARYDGSNKMGHSTTARWLPTWNVSGKWNVDQENFWPENRVVTSLVLRSSYGLTANIGAATNSSAVYYNQISRRPYINDQETLTYISDLENSQLTWEKSKDLDVGMDVGFFKNRMNLTVDYYRKNIFDLLGNLKTSGIGGQSEKVGNYGQMQGRGIEFTLAGTAVKTKDFTWVPRFNMAINHNEITVLETNPSVWRGVSAEGGAVLHYPQRAIFSVRFGGLDHYFGYPKFYALDESNELTPQVNLQGDDVGYLKYEGPADPTLTGGFWNQFTYKQFQISALLKFSTGNVLRLSPAFKSGYADYNAMSKDVVNRWVMPGDEKFTSVPAFIDPVSAQQIVDASGSQVSVIYPYNLYNYSDERVVSGDYLKLSNVSFSYILPTRVCDMFNLTNAAVSVVANNIWTIYSDKRLNGQDPEFFASGGVALPSSKQVTFSLKLGF